MTNEGKQGAEQWVAAEQVIVNGDKYRTVSHLPLERRPIPPVLVRDNGMAELVAKELNEAVSLRQRLQVAEKKAAAQAVVITGAQWMISAFANMGVDYPDGGDMRNRARVWLEALTSSPSQEEEALKEQHERRRR